MGEARRQEGQSVRLHDGVGHVGGCPAGTRSQSVFGCRSYWYSKVLSEVVAMLLPLLRNVLQASI